MSAQCKDCGGTHYGSIQCPYRCEKCGTNTEPCTEADCQRNARWAGLVEAGLCATCYDTGQVCVGNSGRDDDGNAPLMEPCPECAFASNAPDEQAEPKDSP